jgi:hypothetical protein
LPPVLASRRNRANPSNRAHQACGRGRGDPGSLAALSARASHLGGSRPDPEGQQASQQESA